MTPAVQPASAAFDALYSGPKLYCVPGVTSERCRGTFWETGKLYQKGQEGGVLSAAEYSAALESVRALRASLVELGKLADDGAAQAVGNGAAKVRGELRVVGERLNRSGFLG